MDAWKHAVFLISVWALLQYRVHPLLARHWVSADISVKVARAGTLAMVEMLRNLSLRVAITLAIVLTALRVINALDWLDVSLPKAIIVGIDSLSDAFNGIQGTFSKLVVGITLAGAAIILYLTKLDAQARTRAKLNELVAAVQEQFRSHPDLFNRLAKEEDYAGLYGELGSLLQRQEALVEARNPQDRAELEALQSAIQLKLHEITVRYALQNFDPVDALRTAKSPDAGERHHRSVFRSFARLIAGKGLAKDLGFIRTAFDRVVQGALRTHAPAELQRMVQYEEDLPRSHPSNNRSRSRIHIDPPRLPGGQQPAHRVLDNFDC